MKDLKEFMATVIQQLESQGRYGTAHVYQSTLNAFERYWKVKQEEAMSISNVFNAVTLKDFERYLLEGMLSMNTVSTYMRMLRAIYYRATKEELIKGEFGLFDEMYTGIRADTKRALKPENMGQVLHKESTHESLREAQIWFTLLFFLRGMSFIDLARLRKCDLHGNLLIYKRQKTDRVLSVIVPPEAMKLIHLITNHNPNSPYLLSILPDNTTSSKQSNFGSKEEYHIYQATLRSFNRRLETLSHQLGIDEKMSSYTARHTWATTAYQQKCATGIICNALGHSSVKVTETYLKAFEQAELDKTNKMIISYVKEAANKKGVFTSR